MEFESFKDKTSAPSNIILGVEVHLQDFLRECKVSFSPTKKRCEEILHQVRECERRGIITIMEAGFILTTIYRSLGREAIQPLINRVAAKKSIRGFTKTNQFWTVDTTHMKDFFQEILTNLPALEFWFRKYTRVKVIVYSDTSFNLMWSGLGFVVIDQETGERFVSAVVCPPWLLVIWSNIDRTPWLLHDDLLNDEQQQQHINALERLVLVTVVWTCGKQIFRDRQVLFFIDNTAVLSVAVVKRMCQKSAPRRSIEHTSLVFGLPPSVADGDAISFLWTVEDD